MGYIEDTPDSSKSFSDLLDSTIKLSNEATLLGKPKR